MTRWLLRIFSVIALAGFAAAVWFGGPLIRFADIRPLGPGWLRATIIGVILALLALFTRCVSGKRGRRKKRSKPSLRTMTTAMTILGCSKRG
ncbi:hypothetical protein [Mesorhizobium sp. ORM16]|uniref:hypothetical protein n=1 Tax=Mesorhizobium sp. ORM16 TaxID=3376989 RepID=UPI00385736FC